MGDYEMGELRRDRFSELPSSLIFHILSFLPMRDVVSTSLLSKAWNNLWTTVPCLHFRNRSKSCSLEMFRNFVNRVLISWKGTQIQKFEIDTGPGCCISLSRDLGLWIGFAVEKKIEELNIHLWSEGGVVVYETPQCLKSCSSLRKLSLVCCSLRIHGSPTWNQLKSLEIHDSYVSEQLINQILLGSPQLDDFDLRLWDSNENLSILSTSLKKLTINKYAFSEEDDPSLGTTLKICCPNIVKLEISGVLYGKCFLTNVSSLTDATLGFGENFEFWEARDELLGETLKQILLSTQHIEKVTLSSWCVEVLGVSPKKYLPLPLPNVKFLKLYVDDIKVSDIMNILGVFPNLETLMIEDIPFLDIRFVDDPQWFESNLSMSFMLQAKTIEIASCMHCGIYQLIGFLLKHASMLEKLVIRSKIYVSSESGSCPDTYFLKVAKVVLNMPRSSPTATVIFKTS